MQKPLQPVGNVLDGQGGQEHAQKPLENTVTRAAEHAGGVFSLDGQMIDGPVLRQAEVVLSRVSGTRTDPAPEN